MPARNSRRRGWGPFAIAVLALGCVLAPAPASGMAAAIHPGDGALSPRLAELAKPAVRTASRAKQAKDLSLARSGPGSLLRQGNRVLVEARFDRGVAGGIADLRATGAKIVNVSRRYRTVTVAAKPTQLKALSGVPRMAGATEVLTPFTAESSCPAGGVASEGDAQLRAAEARGTFAVNGSKVTVGILSDSFDRAFEAPDGSGPIATHKAEDVATGDLPGFANTCEDGSTPVEVVDDPEEEGEDEGRAMAQIVHDLAPGANLAFATAFAGETAFAENIEKLAKSPAEGGEGAKVVVDDVTYPGEPFFQEGPIAVAVRKATEAGATYFSSAANNSALSSGQEIGSWEAAQFRNSGGCPQVIQATAAFNGNACMDFDPGPEVDRTLGIRVAPGGTLKVDLQWNEPWLGVETNLDAYLLDSNGNLIAGSNADNPGVSQRPLEFFEWENNSAALKTVQLVVNRSSGSGSPRLKVAFLENGSNDVTAIEYPRSSGTEIGGPATDVVGPTVFGHNGAADAVSMAAVHRPPESFTESYSSRGPVTHYFGPVSGVPAGKLPSPERLSKPDLAATDCVSTTFFAFFEESAWRFCGTSAAAPHAAAVAALMREKEPLAIPGQIRDALLSSASPVGGSDECAVGAGLVDAVGAIEDLTAVTPPAPPELECEPPIAEVLVGEAQATGSWGSESPPSPPVSPPPPSSNGGSTPEQPQPPPPETSQKAPTTFFLRHPQRVMKTRGASTIARFALGSNDDRATFLCRIDGGATRTCPAQFTRRFRLGSHTIQVVARDSAGNTDRSPLVFRFTVKRIVSPAP